MIFQELKFEMIKIRKVLLKRAFFKITVCTCGLQNVETGQVS